MNLKSVSLVFASAAFLIACGGGQSNPSGSNVQTTANSTVGQATIQKPSYHVGQSWTYSVADVYADGSKKSYTPTFAVTAVNADGSYTIEYSDPSGFLSKGKETFDASHAQLTDSVGGNSCIKTTPYLEVHFPLSANSTWNNNSTFNCSDGSSVKTVTSHSTSTLSAITVKAGAFSDGYLINLSGSVTVLGFPSQTVAQSDYYSPKVGAIIYRKGTVAGVTSTTELISYIP